MDERKGNRREFLRLRLDLPVELIRIAREGSVPEGTWTEGQMVEIGGGGAALLSPIEIRQGDVLCMRFAIPDTLEEIKAYARVVDVCKVSQEVCVKFVELSEIERGKILRYAFREQIRRFKDSAMSHSNPLRRSDSDESGSDN